MRDFAPLWTKTLNLGWLQATENAERPSRLFGVAKPGVFCSSLTLFLNAPAAFNRLNFTLARQPPDCSRYTFLALAQVFGNVLSVPSNSTLGTALTIDYGMSNCFSHLLIEPASATNPDSPKHLENRNYATY